MTMTTAAVSNGAARRDAERSPARLAALMTIGLVAVSGGLLSEMNRTAHVDATPAALMARG